MAASRSSATREADRTPTDELQGGPDQTTGDQPAGNALAEACPYQSPARETATLPGDVHTIDIDKLPESAQRAPGSTDVGPSLVGAMKQGVANMPKAEMEKFMRAAGNMVSSPTYLAKPIQANSDIINT